jgi:hypothetical protein
MPEAIVRQREKEDNSHQSHWQDLAPDMLLANFDI